MAHILLISCSFLRLYTPIYFPLHLTMCMCVLPCRLKPLHRLWLVRWKMVFSFLFLLLKPSIRHVYSWWPLCVPCAFLGRRSVTYSTRRKISMPCCSCHALQAAFLPPYFCTPVFCSFHITFYIPWPFYYIYTLSLLCCLSDDLFSLLFLFYDSIISYYCSSSDIILWQ